MFPLYMRSSTLHGRLRRSQRQPSLTSRICLYGPLISFGLHKPRSHRTLRSILPIRLRRVSFPRASMATQRMPGRKEKTYRMEVRDGYCDTVLKANASPRFRAHSPQRAYWRSAERVYTDILRRVHHAGDAVIVSMGVLVTHIIIVRDGIPATGRQGTGVFSRAFTILPRETLGLFRMLARDTCAGRSIQLFKVDRRSRAAAGRSIRGKLGSDRAGAEASEYARSLCSSRFLWDGSAFADGSTSARPAAHTPFSIMKLDAVHTTKWVSGRWFHWITNSS